MSAFLSDRCLLASKPALSYFEAFNNAFTDLYDERTNPDGNIVLAVAENKNVMPLFKEKIRECRDITDDVVNYNSMKGLPRFRAAISKFMEQRIIKRSVDPEHLVVSAGCGSSIQNIFYCICNPGDGVLIPTPCYTAFRNDLTVVMGCTPLFMKTEGPENEVTVECLNRALAEAREKGVKVRALLLCSPLNPTGKIYTREELNVILKWVDDHELHLVSDEIYANSVFDHNGAPFVSVAEVRGGQSLGDRTHILWGFSKDFCLNGLRCGVTFTENRNILDALSNINYFSLPSQDTQFALACMLEDEAFVDRYLKAACQALATNYRILEAGLKELRIPFTPARAAQFCYIDLRSYLRDHTAAGEVELFNRLLKQCKLLLTPGLECQSGSPGFFRVCFAWVTPAGITEAVKRLAKLVNGHNLAN
eukprot:Colp12_sorted_trinity150504_noHs@26412